MHDRLTTAPIRSSSVSAGKATRPETDQRWQLFGPFLVKPEICGDGLEGLASKMWWLTKERSRNEKQPVLASQTNSP